MPTDNRFKLEPIISWVLAIILCPLGVCLAAKSSFGVSMIEAPVYVIYLKVSQFLPFYTFGMSEYVLQAILLAVMCIVIRKFKWQYLLSFATAFIFGLILDGWNFLLAGIPTDTLYIRIIYAVISAVMVAFAVALFFRTWLPLEVWELFVKEVSLRFNFKITTVKWIYDFSSLFAGVVLMFLLLGKLRTDAIGIGTVVTTVINAPLINFSTKIQNKIFSKFK